MGLSQRLLLLGLLLQQLCETDWESGEALDRWLLRGAAMLHDPAIPAELDKLPKNKQMCLLNNYKVLALTVKQGVLRDMRLFEELRASVFSVSPDQEEDVVLHLDRYRALEEKLEDLLDHSEYFFENLMVAATFGKGFPALSSPEDLWKSYVGLCALYSFYRCTAVCACGKEASRERLFHILVRASRHTLHNKIYFDKMIDDCFKRDNASLAYLTILVNG